MGQGIAKLIEQIQNCEKEELYKNAQSTREKLLSSLIKADHKCFLIAADFLANEKVTIRGVQAAKQIEPFYLQLHSLIQQKLGADNVVTASVKRKLARIYYIQNRLRQAISLVKQASSVFSIELGKNSKETIEAVLTLMSWCKEIGLTEAKRFDDWVWKEYPFCDCLKPVEDYVASQAVKIIRQLHYRGLVEIYVDAWLDVDSIREKLRLDPCAEKFEFDDMKSGSFRGFVCSNHKHRICGHYEQNSKWPTIR